MRAAAFLIAALSLAACGRGEQSRNMTREQVAGQLTGIRIEPGLWELTSEVVDVSGPNLPRQVRNHLVGPRPSVRNCVTPEQAAHPSANFLASGSGDDCTYRDFSMRGSRLRGAMTCPAGQGLGPTSATMEGNYFPSRYDMRMDMRSRMPDGSIITMKIRSNGRRIGECEGEGRR